MFTRNINTSNGYESHSKPIRKQKVAPKGCFTVYVGPEKQGFAIKIEYLNYPLFKMLLEDSEMEYGFSCKGPLQIPCEVDLFRNVLAEMSSSNKEFDNPPIMGSAYGFFSQFSPARLLGKMSITYKDCGSYALLT